MRMASAGYRQCSQLPPANRMPHEAQIAAKPPNTTMMEAKKITRFWKRLNPPDQNAAYNRMKTSHPVPSRIVRLVRQRIPRRAHPGIPQGGPVGGGPLHGGP